MPNGPARRRMLSDARDRPAGEQLRTEVCVIGSGAAGTTLAVELIGAGVDVVVLEGGGIRLEPDAQATYRGHLSEGTVHDPLDLVRQKRLGGTTHQWGGRCAPLQAIDFEARPWVPHSGWPVDLGDLLPHYRRAHHYCDLGAFAYLAREALGEAIPFVAGGRPTLVSDEALWRWSPPVKFWRRFRSVMAASRNARVLYHANVVRLERDPAAGRITRAVAAAAPGRHFEVEARIYVLAAGGLDCARLLLASNRESPDGIGNEHDLVGRFYMTHPVAEVGTVAFGQSQRAAAGAFQRAGDGVYCRRMLRLTEEAQQRYGLRNLAAALWYPDPLDPSHRDGLLSAFALVRAGMAGTGVDWKSTGVHARYGDIADVPAHVRNVARDFPRVVRYGTTWVRRRWYARRSLPSFMSDHRTGSMRLRFDAEQAPDHENRITLTRDRDAFGVPRLRLHYRVNQADRASIARSLGLIRDEFHRLEVGTVEVPADEDGLDDIAFGDGTHQMGVTRMSDSPRRGVVDRDCRVHGAPNLYVVSSSVFPTSGSVGPTLTVVALAIRAAEVIRRDLERLRSAARPVDTAPAPG